MTPHFTADEIRQALGPLHRAERGPVPAAPLEGVSTDSRTIKGEQVFVALDGPRHKGWDHAPAALSAGALVVLAGPGVFGDPGRAGKLEQAWVIETGDTRHALGAMGRAWRARMGAKVCAVTGSCGKTTVRAMAAAILSQAGPTLASPGSYNNDVGVPLTLLRLNPQHRFLVQEMGMNHEGEIAALCETAQPEIGLITLVGRAHLGHFDSIEAIARAKGELMNWLDANGGTKVVNLDDPLVAPHARTHGRARILTYGKGQGDIAWEPLPSDGWTARLRITFDGRSVEALVPQPGRFTASNAASAAALALAAGATLDHVRDGLAQFEGEPMRFEIFREFDETTFINDAYNANPDSMRASIDAFMDLPVPGRRFVLLGDMGELGEAAESSHREVGRFAAQRGVDDLCAIGQWAVCTATAFSEETGDPTSGFAASDDEEVNDWVARVMTVGDGLLVKGSRSSRMERFCHGHMGGAH